MVPCILWSPVITFFDLAWHFEVCEAAFRFFLLPKKSPSKNLSFIRPHLAQSLYLVNQLPSVTWAKLGQGHTELGTVSFSLKDKAQQMADSEWHQGLRWLELVAPAPHCSIFILVLRFLSHGRLYSNAASLAAPTNPSLLLLPPAVL